jgi:type I site-specific restriction endonuclease
VASFSKLWGDERSPMTGIVDIKEVRLNMAVRRGYRNWKSQFQEDFGRGTRLCDISTKTLAQLALGKDSSTFYLFDIIMNLRSLGSGFEFSELKPQEKMSVMDQYLFLLDRIRFEYMKRLGWLEAYPGEEFALVDLVLRFEELAPRFQTATPVLSRDHAAYPEFRDMSAFEREELIRKLIPKALKEIQDQSTTL